MAQKSSETVLPELLAPAGSIDALRAAVNAGADAVYLAGRRFGARHYASNFQDTELLEALDYAHLNGVKVYVTVNTLIKDSELDSVAVYLLWLYEIGIDAVIIQDLGVAGLVREIVPDMEMHASTQMTIHSLEGVEWARDFGFKRVILSREVKLQEIRKILKETAGSIEVEVFGHGALCYSYSGQCLMSSFIGGRSGNRGMCAQPCRKPYHLVHGEMDEHGIPSKLSKVNLEEKYLLSTRDLSVYRHLHELVESGVHSIKIEGRMRSPEYVAVVVNIYRRALDAIADGEWLPHDEDVSNLKLAFNRGFTKGYIMDAGFKSVMGRSKPGNRGLYVGDVVGYKAKSREVIVKVTNAMIPQRGDGVVFKGGYAGERDYGMVLNEDVKVLGRYGKTKKGKSKQVKIALNVNKPLKEGYKLFITRRKSLMDSADSLIHEVYPHPIPVDMKIHWDKDRAAHLTCEFRFNGIERSVEYVSPFKFEKAIKKPLETSQIKKQLRKTGGTPFKIKKLDIDYHGDLFAPVSKLNQLRREVLTEVEKTVLGSFKNPERDLEAAKNRYHNLKSNLTGNLDEKRFEVEEGDTSFPFLSIYINDSEAIDAACKAGCKCIYLEPNTGITCSEKDYENYFKDVSDVLKDACKLCRSYEVDLIWKWPNIIPEGYINHALPIINELTADERLNLSGVMVDDVGTAKSLKNMFEDLKIFGSMGINLWNHRSAREISETFDAVTLSPELSGEEIFDLVRSFAPLRKSEHKGVKLSLELMVQGSLEVMTTEDGIPCLLKPEKKIETPNFKEIQREFLGIKDVKNLVFPVRWDCSLKTHILNSVELCLLDHLPQIINMGMDSVAIDARGKPPEYAKIMVSAYVDALESCKKPKSKGELKKKLNMIKSDVKKFSTGGITTGNFIRGVKI
jgi:putative protease